MTTTATEESDFESLPLLRAYPFLEENVRARWLGHRLHAEVNVAVDARLTVAEGHAVATELRHKLLHALPHLGLVVIHVDPPEQSGETHHRIDRHEHDGLPAHSHAA
jgi:Dimerisation domain of Zinc Transporter